MDMDTGPLGACGSLICLCGASGCAPFGQRYIRADADLLCRLQKNRITKVDRMHDRAKRMVSIGPPTKHVKEKVDFCMCFIFHISIISAKRLKITGNVNA